MKGQELSRRFYEEYGRPMLREQFGAYEEQIAAGSLERVLTVLDMMMRFPGIMISRRGSAFGSRSAGA